MKSFLYIFFCVALALLPAACADDVFPDNRDNAGVMEGDRAETFDVPLRLHAESPRSIGRPLIKDIATRAEGGETPADPEKAAEEAIKDIWVFQYDENGDQLIAPRFYTVESTEIRRLNIRLAEGKDSHVYVLANTGDAHWAEGKDLSTTQKFIAYKYPFDEEMVEMGDDEFLLMEGNVKETIRKESDLLPIDIHLTRMMAKISFKYVTNGEAKNLTVNRVLIHNLPEDMRMEETESGNYPEGDFATRSITINKQLRPGDVYTFYMPANRRGNTTNTEPGLKNDHAPDKALYIQLFITSKSNGSNFLYTIYPGDNDYNNFDVKRNHNYNIQLTLNSEGRDNRVLAAPANCFVMKLNDDIMFDPYTRTEDGGGWKYSDYVNKNEPKKRIARVGILWQYTDVIGNNSDGKRVFMDDSDRIHVKSGNKYGNAVIAAYNSDNEIIWSWHIWVCEGQPANLENAVAYNTFGWNTTSGILSSAGRNVKGRSLMTCNLGARHATNTKLPSYGMVYQWGRKDPFPIGNIEFHVDFYAYNRANVGELRNNNNGLIAMTTDGSIHTSELFSTERTGASVGTINYTLKHPTHFITPVKSPTSNSNPSGADYCDNDGDWFWGHNDLLWGGKPYASAKKFTVPPATDGCVLSDNGATKKSIFDPCPAGWMVPPGDMWLGFTDNGTNARNAAYSRINSIHSSDNTSERGFNMYVQQWKKGKTVYFPSQGLRTAGGRPWRNGMCGNYHTSSAAQGGRVNIFHLHTPGEVDPFETSYGYTRRAVAGPVRCVRDTDD